MNINTRFTVIFVSILLISTFFAKSSHYSEITADRYCQPYPEIYGNYVVWGDGKNRNEDIYDSSLSILPVPYVSQEETDWCSLASTVMCLRYYGIDTNLWEEAKDLELGKKDRIKIKPKNKFAEFIMSHLGEKYITIHLRKYYDKEDIETKTLEKDPAFKYVRKKIDDDMPVIMTCSHKSPRYGDIKKHTVVIVGYETTAQGAEYIFIHDPSWTIAVDYGSRIDASYYRNVRIPWDEFWSNLNYGFWSHFKDAKIDILTIKDEKDEKKATIQIRKNIYFDFKELRYRTRAGKEQKISSSSTYFVLDKGLSFKVSPNNIHTYVREDGSVVQRDDENKIIDRGQLIGWDVTDCLFTCKPTITSIDEEEYKAIIYFKDTGGNQYLFKGTPILISEKKKEAVKFDFKELGVGEYTPIILIVTKENNFVTEAILPKIKIIGDVTEQQIEYSVTSEPWYTFIFDFFEKIVNFFVEAIPNFFRERLPFIGREPESIEEKAIEKVRKDLDILSTWISFISRLSKSTHGISEGEIPEEDLRFEFEYEIVGAKFFHSMKNAENYMDSMGIDSIDMDDTSYIISELGLEQSGFCIVIIDYFVVIAGDAEEGRYPIVCDEKGNPFWKSWHLYERIQEMYEEIQKES